MFSIYCQVLITNNPANLWVQIEISNNRVLFSITRVIYSKSYKLMVGDFIYIYKLNVIGILFISSNTSNNII